MKIQQRYANFTLLPHHSARSMMIKRAIVLEIREFLELAQMMGDLSQVPFEIGMPKKSVCLNSSCRLRCRYLQQLSMMAKPSQNTLGNPGCFPIDRVFVP